MKNNIKNQVNESAMKNLKGFCKKGAAFQSPGNVPTGHFELDFILQYGKSPSDIDFNDIKGYDPSKPLGLPLGKLVELFGEEGGGKSSMAYRVVGYAQKMGYPVGWIDTEHSFSDSLSVINGCDPSEIWYSSVCNYENPEKDFHAEDVMDQIQIWCSAGIKVIVLDSVANLVTKDRYESDAEQKKIADLPRLLGQNVGKIVGFAEKYGTLIIFINQIREKIGVMYGDNKTTPGGRSVKHNASVRLQVAVKKSKTANITITDDEGKEELIGRWANVYIKKSRLAKPYFDAIKIPIYYEFYFPGIEGIAFDTARQIKLITVRKNVYSLGDIKIEGRNSFIKHIKDNKLIDKLIKTIKNKSEKDNILLPPEITQYETAKSFICKDVSRTGKNKNSKSSES